MNQLSLFGPGDANREPKAASDAAVRLRLIVTVKAAPNPSGKYGETVCVAGLNADPARPGWIRLYPINFRDLGSDDRFRKYDMISGLARPARQDQRRESWTPILDTMLNESHLAAWRPRRPWIDPFVDDSMCRVYRDACERPDAPSLGLIRPREVLGMVIDRHPGWTQEEQRKIDHYVNQLDLLSDQDRTPLQAPRFRAYYRYRCHDANCRSHRQGLLDWEFVAFQRKLQHLSDTDARTEIENQFLHRLCAPDRDVAFYVGNQAKRVRVFSVLGVYWPPRR